MERPTLIEITRQRLHNQQLTQSQFTQPGELVAWFGAVQAQDYGAAKWALGLRLPGTNDDTIDQAFNDGAILRTHVMRPTWHFILPEDIRWMQELTADRVRPMMAYNNRRLGLDEAIYARTNDLLAKALAGGQQWTRVELADALSAAGITSDNLGITHIMMRAELDGVICSGARRGKQFTYALLDERAPEAKSLPREEALAKLTERYFRSHAPATLKDYAWWSGLTVADCRAGLEMIGGQLVSEEIDGETYWMVSSAPVAQPSDPTAFLLPNFDEYGVAYTDRSAAIEEAYLATMNKRRSALLDYNVVIDGQIVGSWKRTLKKAVVMVETTLFVPLDGAQIEALAAAAQRYADFLGLRLDLVTA